MGGNDNHGYDPVINNLASIREKGASVEIDPFDMSKLFPHDMDEFYRYQGGLTTPGCNEIVTWTVFKVSKYNSDFQCPQIISLRSTKMFQQNASKFAIFYVLFVFHLMNALVLVNIDQNIQIYRF